MSRLNVRTSKPSLEHLEDRLVPASADLIAYRPVADYINYANFRVLDNQEDSHSVGAGIRINGDDDNGKTGADFTETGPTAADKDLVSVDVAAVGTSRQLTYTGNLKVWTSDTKQQAIVSGATISSGTVWVEYINPAHTTDASSAVLTLMTSDGSGSSATDKVVFHTFHSIVVAIGGNGQNPANNTTSFFPVAMNFYQQGYDVHLFKNTQVSRSGAGAAYQEIVSAITGRDVSNVAIFGFSYGGGATADLAAVLKANASLQGQYTLSYTAYIDGIVNYSFLPSSERRLPAGTAYHDNIYQRRDWFTRGNSVTGANTNLNVNTTTWGQNLGHTSIDDAVMVHSIIITNLPAKMTVK